VTTIGPTISISGQITSDEDITLQGRVNGQVHVRAAICTIDEQAQLRADVRGTRVVVKGQLKGSIVATERIELEATAAVDGTLSADRVVLTDGTRFNGSIDMGQRTLAARVAQFKASHAPSPDPSARR
jgi:cytoskeletal protein CcmA (bactofilin family)